MIEYRVGDLFKQTDLNGWIHACNCFNKMGSGVAKIVKETYPEVYEADCKTLKGDRNKLGTFSFAKTHDGKIGYNLYSQFFYGRNLYCYTDYDAMESGLKKIKVHVINNISNTAKIGIPSHIGCVRGRGNWNEVLNIIKEIFEKSNITIIICEFKEYSQQNEDDLKKLRSAYKKADLLGIVENVEN